MKRFRLAFMPLFFLIVSLVLLLASPGQIQALMLKLSLKELTTGADSIVIGTVVERKSQWNAQRTRIYTSVIISVEEGLKGRLDQDRVLITVPGGEVEGIRQWVSDTPDFRMGERVVVFLKQLPKAKFEVYGYFQGKLTIEQGRVGNLPLERFKGQINKILQGKTILNDNYKEPKVLIVEQSIDGISPNSASAGTNSQITITGSGFGTQQGSVHFFYCQDQPTITGGIVSWSDTSIVVTVPVGIINNYPASASSGWVYVRTAGGAESARFHFTVTFSYGGVKWPGDNPVVNYFINPNCAELPGDVELQAVQNAATTWNAVPNKNFLFNYAGATTATTYSQNGSNEILWQNLEPDGTVAIAACWSTDTTILETDMVFNDSYTWSTATTPPAGQYDVWTIALHEYGHWLLLRDLYGNLPNYPQDVDKAMFGFGSEGGKKRALHTDDRAGIQWIYPGTTPPPGITVTSPNGGEVWNVGTPQNITWRSTGTIANVKLEYSKDNFATSTIIASTSNDGSHPWTVPNDPSATVRVRISDATNPGVNDTSNANFTIAAAAPSLILTSPNGGEVWRVGAIQKITWKSTKEIANVKLEYSKDNFQTSTVISASIPNDGSRFWIIPNDPSTTVRVRISDVANPGVNDTSNSDFEIKVVEITDIERVIVYPNLFKPKEGHTGIIFLNLPENTTIRIYNIAGELAYIKEGAASKFTWDGRNNAGNPVASGVYRYIITDPKGGIKRGKIGILW